MSHTIIEQNGSVLTVKPEGRVDTETSPILEKEIQPYLDGVTEVIMDFERVEYISSGGLRLLLATEQKLEEHDGSLKLIHANEYIIEILEMMGFMDVIDVIID